MRFPSFSLNPTAYYTVNGAGSCGSPFNSTMTYVPAPSWDFTRMPESSP